jgi:hypothetical protein
MIYPDSTSSLTQSLSHDATKTSALPALEIDRANTKSLAVSDIGISLSCLREERVLDL